VHDVLTLGTRSFKGKEKEKGIKKREKVYTTEKEE